MPKLSDMQWQEIRRLADSLDARQLLWVSGFLAGVSHRADAPSRRDALASASDEARPPAVRTRNLTVLYGSETGNSAAVALSLAGRLEAQGRTARLLDMAAYKTRELANEQDLLIVTSTYGEGDPPQPAAGFFEFVEGRKAPKLSDLRFAVLALGDSTYEQFCEAGKRLDRRFEELGGTRVAPRVDCDVDYEEAAAASSADIVALLSTGDGTSAEPPSRSPVSVEPVSPFDKCNPFPSRIIDNIVLTGRGSTKETRHIELSLEGSGLTFEPGDALGVVPTNDPRLVEAILFRLST